MNPIRYAKTIDGRETIWESEDGCLCRLASLQDTTSHEKFEYDPNCSDCYLGHGHSGDYHRKELAEFQKRNNIS